MWEQVVFAAVGTPGGSCSAGFTHNASCDSGASVMAAVEKICLGQPSCSFSLVVGHTSTVGAKTDPCTGTIKSTLSGQYTYVMQILSIGRCFGSIYDRFIARSRYSREGALQQHGATLSLSLSLSLSNSNSL